VRRTYVFAPAAADELREIIRYTMKRWGMEQARAYSAAIEATASDLAAEQGAFKDLSALHPRLRAALSGKHYVFCLLRYNQPAIVLAILHERMDIMARLKIRLSIDT
jgi:plasmid stabilization system protein ParE